MSKSKSWSLKEVVVAFLVTAFVLLLHGAVPFLMIPTLGQAVWSMGFSESFAKGSFFSIYAYDFGIPKPAPIAFGLAGAWPASLLIRMGLEAADAYATIVAVWLLVATYSAYLIARRFGATRFVALLGSAAWLSMPIIWEHAGYSMLSLGIALLSFYFVVAFQVLLIEPGKTLINIRDCILFCAAAIISIFMDGYTFMMFATGCCILLVYSFATRPEIRATLIKISIPLLIIGFAFAYFLFSKFIGKSSFDAQSLDLFRGWGLDLAFVVLPTTSLLWLPDLLGLSVDRSDHLYFGDASVWKTTFSAPVALLGMVAWWCLRRQLKIITGILLVALFAFYMALGPSLKINSFKPESLQISQPGQLSASMPAKYGIMPTGNAWLSEHIPGFNVMRASYRWWALGVFALWLLFIIMLSRADSRMKIPLILALFALISLNMPDIEKKWQESTTYRDMFQQINDNLVVDLKKHIHRNETVAFIPWGNDFMANYVAPKAGFRSFNIGGDKNLFAAMSDWPSKIRELGPTIDINNPHPVSQILVDEIVDVVVLPYFDMLWASHYWPCSLPKEDVNSTEVSCIQKQSQKLQPFVQALKELSYLEVEDAPYFSSIRIRPEFTRGKNRALLSREMFGDVQYPISIGKYLGKRAVVLTDGWYALEADHVWSGMKSGLRLPIPEGCERVQCNAVLKFSVFGASLQRPVSVVLDGIGKNWKWQHRLTANTSDELEVKIPLRGGAGTREIAINVPEATSPQALNASNDSRVLGIALRNINLEKR